MTRQNQKARRLRAAADDARERFDHLDGQREAALDGCYPGPAPAVVERARQEWLAAEAAAEAARAGE